MIALSRCIFPKGTKGCNIERYRSSASLANLPELWTWYGAWDRLFFLNVHEGPQAIRQELKNQDVVPGMVTSDEPGLYREGSHGIRHENMILCIPVSKNEFGEWYGFETLTLCYFDTSALLLDLLSEDEKKMAERLSQNSL